MSKTKIRIEYNRFYADEPGNKWKSYTIPTIQNDHYGDELDIVTTYQYRKNINLMLGLSYFNSGDFIEEASTKNSFITSDNVYGMFAQFQYKF